MPDTLPDRLTAAGRDSAAADASPEWAWAAYQPSDQCPWSPAWAGHLFRRAGFGAMQGQLTRAVREGPQATVDRVLKPAGDVASFNRDHDDYESAAGDANALRAWWLQRMIGTPQPLLEKMTLFWHDHFAIGAHRVPQARLLRDHVRLLRSHAMGDFAELVRAIVVDPATLLALGADANRKAAPSELISRQLLRRFTVGEGRFAAADVREVARSLTGWFVLRGELRFFEREHDDGPKHVLGQEGNFDGPQVVRVLLAQPTTARHIVRRLYRWLISEVDEPSDALIAPLADRFAADYNVGNVVETMLRSNLFFSPAAYRRKVKRPVEFALGLVQGFEANVPTLRLGNDLAALGERLYDPPTVSGWAGGAAWINPATMIARSNLALDLVSPSGPYGQKIDPAAVAAQHGFRDAAAAQRFLVQLLVQDDLPASTRESLREDLSTTGGLSDRLRRLTHRIASLPEFQLA